MSDDTRSVRLDWTGNGLRFRGAGTGPTTPAIEIDGDGEVGPSPMLTLLLAAAGCSAADVVVMLEKMRAGLTHLAIEVEGVRRETDPRRYDALHLRYLMQGEKGSSSSSRVSPSLPSTCRRCRGSPAFHSTRGCCCGGPSPSCVGAGWRDRVRSWWDSSWSGGRPSWAAIIALSYRDPSSQTSGMPVFTGPAFTSENMCWESKLSDKWPIKSWTCRGKWRMSGGCLGYESAAAVIWSLPGARPMPKSIRPGYRASNMRKFSATLNAL